MPKILVLVNTLTEVNSFVYANHVELLTYSNRTIEDIKIVFYTPHRMSIDRARNQAAIQTLALDFDYLCFLDDDVMVHHTGLEKLLDAKQDIVAGLVMIRGYPFNVMAFKYNKKKQLTFFNRLPKENGKLKTIAECDAVGFSFALIRADILRKMEPPYFITGPANTEDVYFCLKAQDTITPKPTIALRTDVECGHLMSPEGIQYSTKGIFKKFYRDLDNHAKKVYKRNLIPEGRNLAYIERCIAKLS